MDTTIQWAEKDGSLIINIPKGIRKTMNEAAAVVFQISK